MLKPFDSVTVYSISGFHCCTGEEISALLAQSVFSPCRDADLSRAGWVTEEDGFTPLSVITGSDAVFFYRIDTKRISRPLINQRVNAGVKEWMRRTGYKKIKSSERKRIKSEVVAAEIKSAYQKKTSIPVWFDLESQRLYVGTRSSEVAELVVSSIRSCCTSIPAIPVVSEAGGREILSTMTAGPVTVIGGRYERLSDGSYMTLFAVDNIDKIAPQLIKDGYSPDFIEIDTGEMRAKVSRSLSIYSIRFNFRAVKSSACVSRQVAAIKSTINKILG